MAKTDNDKEMTAELGGKTEGVWFILERCLENYCIQVSCQEVMHDRRTGSRMSDPDTSNKHIKFEDGLYYTEDKSEIKSLRDSRNYIPAERPHDHRTGYRECTKEEVMWLEVMKRNGHPRKEWHKRLKQVEQAATGVM